MQTMARWQQISLSLPRCSYLCAFSKLFVGRNRAHIVRYSLENAHLTIYQGASGCEKRSNE